MLDATTVALKRLIVRGKERGYVTFDELNRALACEEVSSEMIEDVMALLNEIGLHLVGRGGAEDGEAAVVGPRKPLSPLPLQSGAEAPLDRSQG